MTDAWRGLQMEDRIAETGMLGDTSCRCVKSIREKRSLILLDLQLLYASKAEQ